jgi:hypothetical protein
MSLPSNAGAVIKLERAQRKLPECSGAAGWSDGFEATVSIELAGISGFAGAYHVNFKNQWHVRPQSAGADTGRDWPNAWSFPGLNWKWVNPGDTVWLAAGVYPDQLTIGSSGAVSNHIFIRAAQDPTMSGVVTIPRGLFCRQNHVTVDGGWNDQRLIRILSTVDAYGANDVCFYSLEISGADLGISSVFGSGGEIAHCWLYDIRGEAAIRLSGKNQGTKQFDLTRVYQNIIQLNSSFENGLGPDGIQACNGLTVESNYIYGKAGGIESGEHQDLIQGQGTLYHKFHANVFENSADAMIGVDTMGSTEAGKVYIFNNVFRSTTPSGTAAIRYYNSFQSRTVSVFQDMSIENNTFVDLALASTYGLAIRLDGGTGTGSVAQNVHLRNNLFYNCGGGSPVVAIMASAPDAGWDIDYNLLSPGTQGSANIQFVGLTNFTQMHGRSGIPQFISYSVGAPTNNLRLQVTDTAARDMGTPVSSTAIDALGVPRPQGSGWDIGAYESTP